MKGLYNILLEGRIEDAERYIHNAVGLMSDESQEIFDYLVDNDPSGNQKYLMWMVKMYDTDSGFSPNMLQDLVQRFHNNLDKIHPALILQHGDLGMYSGSRIATSPKNIDSYPDYRSLKGVVEAAEEWVTRKEREKEAKTGVDKLYEDNRWLLVRPNTYEGSCYYGSSTKWCTASKDAPQHFASYSKTGNLYYIIDKSKDVGDFFKIALHKDWNGQEKWYDRADNELRQETEEAIRSLLPLSLIKSLEEDHGATPSDIRSPKFTYAQFAQELRDFVNGLGKSIKLKTKSGIWDLEIFDGGWRWNTDDPRIEVVANPFPDGLPHLDINIETEGDRDVVHDLEIVYDVGLLTSNNFGPNDYLARNPTGYYSVDRNMKLFLMHIYTPKVRQVLDSDEMVDFIGVDYKTWNPGSYVSSFQFNYPPRKGTMTQKFTDYLKENPGRTSQQFYEDVLGYSRPRAHNNMFFSSIKDSGIVKMERQGRQFVYSLGPNYEAWTQGKLLRTNKKYGQL